MVGTYKTASSASSTLVTLPTEYCKWGVVCGENRDTIVLQQRFRPPRRRADSANNLFHLDPRTFESWRR
eukprot:scaffold39742_cov86-Phaeocystis_antarctica.AAC.1